MSKRIIMTVVAGLGLGLAGCCMGGASAPAPVSIGPGFSPDPMTMEGSAGGIVDASSFGAGCVGHIGSAANHVLTVTAPIPFLRIAAAANEDITLVVRRPDGTYLCNDDSDGLNPMVEGQFVPGNYDVYVGSYSSEGQFARYRLGLSAAQTMTPSTLGTP